MSHLPRALFALLVLPMLGCLAEKDEHPPVCLDASCVPTGATRFSPSASAGGAGNDSSGSSGNGGVITIAAQVIELDEPTFSVTGLRAPTTGSTFTVRAPTGDNKESATPNLGFAFTLDGVRLTKAAWLVATPSGASDLLSGLYAFDATATTSVVIPLVRRSSLELVNSVLPTFTTLDSTQAQVVLRFIDATGAAVSGISVGMVGAERIAYDVGASYSDDASGTGARGLAFLFNVDSAKTPASRPLSLGGSVTGEFGVWISAGVTTALNLVVSKR